jgi:uncharacterized phage protein gp47/JayE
MAQKLSFRIFTQILKDMFSSFQSATGVNDDNDGSVVKSIFEAAALSDFRVQGDIIAALNSTDVDRAEGLDLDKIGNARGVPRPQARGATGLVSFYSKNFTKLSTKIYAGTAAPPSGSNSVFVSDVTNFPLSGNVYIGRGSNNVEGPIPYSSIVQVGSYYQLVLSSPTTKNHNVNETVVVAQGGNRSINAGTIVQTTANLTTQVVSFRTMVTAVIQDGEQYVTDVPVVCNDVGTKGNVPTNGIVAIAGLPFADAAVTNPYPFVTGKDKLSDPDYRMLIKNFEQTKSKGTDLANRMAAIGTSSTDDNKTVASAQIINPSNRFEPGIMYVDDNTAYQPIFTGQGFEQVIDNANGGEKFLQLRNEDITKALVQSVFTAPFSITGGMVLAVRVGAKLAEHTFSSTDFATQNAVDTFEIVNSINSNTSLPFSARASNNNKQFTIFAKDFVNEDVQVTTPSNPLNVNANDYFAMSTNLTYTLRLYKNDVLLIKDGEIPTLSTLAQTSWSALLATAYLTLSVDGAVPIIYTFTAADFIPYNYAVMTKDVPLSIWAQVINAKINGITATVDGATLKFVSNKGASGLAKLAIYMSAPANSIGIVPVGSNLGSNFFGLSGIETLSSTGKTSDYSFNRSTGQIQLNDSLIAGDVITAGSKNTRAFVSSSKISSGSVNILSSSNPAAMWVIPDAVAQTIVTPTDANTVLTFTNVANLVTVTTSIAGAFANLLPNDLVFLADDAIYALDPDLIGSWRIQSATSNSFSFKMNSSLASAGVVTLLGSRKVQFVRTNGEAQKATILTGFQTLTAISNDLNTQLIGIQSSTVGGKAIKLTSNSFGLSGSLYYVVNTSAADNLGFVAGTYDQATVSHTAFAESQNSQDQFPSFIHDKFTASTAVVPPLNLTSTLNLDNYAFPNQLIEFLNPFTGVSPNKFKKAQIQDFSGVNVTVRPNNKLNDVLANDRYFLSEGYNFDAFDNLVVVLDRDSVNKALNIRMSRLATVKATPTPTQDTFKAYDTDGGATADFANFFGNNFDFNDFKIYLQARQIIDPAGPNNKMLIRSVTFGPSGEVIRFGICYPSAPNSVVTSSVSIKDKTFIKIFLGSGAERLGGAWDISTQFDVTNPSSGTYRYTWNGTGTAPQFVTLANIAVSDIVNLANTSNFSDDNKAIFKVSAVTDTYFEVQSTYGVVENSKTLSGSNDLRFYPLNATINKATDIQGYTNANLASYISIDQLQSGSGVISTSTFDDNLYTTEYVNLVDGENWILQSNVGTTISPVNQFQLKKQLQIPESDPDYTLVDEKFYIIPTSADQIKRFLNVFAITGLSNVGNLTVSSNANKIQIYSNNFGSTGAVQVSGGTANGVTTPLITNGSQLLSLPIKHINRTGSTVVLATYDRHGLSVGQIIQVASANNSSFNGSFTITAVTPKTITYSQTPATITITPTGLARVSNTVTSTTTAPHKLAVGDSFTITGATDASFNGTFAVLTSPSSTTYTYAQAGVDATSGNGNIVNVGTYNGSIELTYTSMSVPKNSSSGLAVNQWVKTNNESIQDKSIGFDTTTLLQLTAPNQLTITGGSGSFQTIHAHSSNNTTELKVERQGDFTAIAWTGTGIAPNFLANVKEGDWVKIAGNFNTLNQGIYKVEKMFQSNTIYILNSKTVEENVTLSANTDLIFYSYDSVMPSDTLYIGSNIFGTSYKGSYTVASTPFPTSTVIYLNTTSFANVGPVALGSEYANIAIKEAAPYYSFKKITNIATDPFNSNGEVIILDGESLANKNTVSAGNSINSVNKLSFDTTVQTGEDSYKFYGGLISAVGKKLRGQAVDPVTYPGYAASGSYLLIDSALPKRIQLGIVVRNQTGINFSTIKARVQTTVASYVNSLGTGEPVVFSQIISEIQKLNGVQAIAIASPTYDSTHDLIAVNYNQKAKIENITVDITVTLAT